MVHRSWLFRPGLCPHGKCDELRNAVEIWQLKLSLDWCVILIFSSPCPKVIKEVDGSCTGISSIGDGHVAQSQHQLSSNVIRYIFIRGLWGGQIKMDFWLRVGQGRRMMKLTGTEFETHLSGSICLHVQKGQKLQQRMFLWSINYYYHSRRLPRNNNTTSQ